MTQKNYICYKIPKCSNNIFIPSNTSIIPPINSALLWYLSPNLFPILTPKVEIINVIPIIDTANNKFTSKNANVIPTA